MSKSILALATSQRIDVKPYALMKLPIEFLGGTMMKFKQYRMIKGRKYYVSE